MLRRDSIKRGAFGHSGGAQKPKATTSAFGRMADKRFNVVSPRALASWERLDEKARNVGTPQQTATYGQKRKAWQ